MSQHVSWLTKFDFLVNDFPLLLFIVMALNGVPTPTTLSPPSLGALLHRLCVVSYQALAHPPRPPGRQALAEDLHRTRVQFAKILVLLKWSQRHLEAVSQASEIIAALDQHDSYFRDAANLLFDMHNNLQKARVPIYDIPTAIDVLTTGDYPRLPTGIVTNAIPPSGVTKWELQDTLNRLNEFINLRLLTSKIPPAFTAIKIGTEPLSLFLITRKQKREGHI